MKNILQSTRVRSVLSSLVIAFTLVTCGPSSVEMMGDAMVDAADTMRDAGRDAADAIRDAAADTIDSATDTGATALADTGSAISDGASDDAMAQPPCTTCTTSGAARTTLASEDPSRAVGGQIITMTHAIELALGPVYVTDASAISYGGLINSSSGQPSVLFATVPMGTFCDDLHFFNGGTVSVGSAEFLTAVSNLSAADAPPIHGGRFFVPSGRRLCAEMTGASSISGVSWAGFRPYD